jgi:hypothetical protein
MIVDATGANRCKATAVLATQGPLDTRQIGVDNSVIPDMWCVVGANKNGGQARPVS